MGERESRIGDAIYREKKGKGKDAVDEEEGKIMRRILSRPKEWLIRLIREK